MVESISVIIRAILNNSSTSQRETEVIIEKKIKKYKKGRKTKKYKKKERSAVHTKEVHKGGKKGKEEDEK